MVFGRHLLPLVPFLCILAGVAIGSLSLLRRLSIPRVVRSALTVVLTAAVILPPAIRAIAFNQFHRSATVSGAYRRILQNVRGNATILIECRNLVLPPGPFKGHNVRQLRDLTFEDYFAQSVDYLVASSQCYGPNLEHPQRFPREYGEYTALFSRTREVARFTPSRGEPWPEMIIFKIERAVTTNTVTGASSAK